MRLPYRVQQVVYYSSVDRQAPPQLPEEARQRLSGTLVDQFAMLSSGDQRHLLRVYRFLKAAGAQDDTVTAGLIHDIGKACLTCNITVVDRCLHVFCKRFVSGPYGLFMSRNVPPKRLTGLHLLANHAKRGAIAAEQCGYNERICWLVRHHEARDNATGSDPELNLLREADDTADETHDHDHDHDQ